MFSCKHLCNMICTHVRNNKHLCYMSNTEHNTNAMQCLCMYMYGYTSKHLYHMICTPACMHACRYVCIG